MIEPTGLVRPSLQELRKKLRERWVAIFGQDIDLSPSSPDGHHVDLESEMISQLYELAQAVWAAYDPNTAEGVFLDIIASYVGMSRIGAAYSTVDAVLEGTAGTVVPAGYRIRPEGGGTDFALTSAATIPAGGATAPLRFVAVAVGPVLADAGDWYRVSTLAGVIGVLVETNGVSGRLQETDAEFRARRKKSVRAGFATEDAIRDHLMETVPGIVSVSVTSNRTRSEDADGRPATSVETVIDGGQDEDIIRELWRCMPAGIQAWGNTPDAPGQPVIDSLGRTQYLQWTRKAPLFTWFKIIIDGYDEEQLPTNYQTAIAESIVAWSETEYVIGRDIIPQRVVAPVYGVPGILHVTVTAAAQEFASPAPDAGDYTDQRISVDARHAAVTDVSKIQVELA